MVKFKDMIRRRVGLFVAVMAIAILGVSGVAGAVPVYDLAPVVDDVRTELVGNLPAILVIVGSLIGLALGVRAIQKFARV